MKKYFAFIIGMLLTCRLSNGMSVTLSKFDDACSENIGWVYAYVSGGTAPYTFSWSNGTIHTPANNVDTLYNAGAATYSIVVYDAVGDSAVNTIVVNNTQTLDRNGSITSVFTNIDPLGGGAGFACPGQANGIMYGLLSFWLYGSEPYTVTFPANAYIDNGPYGQFVVVPSLSTGTMFTVNITDNGGCTGSFYDIENGPLPYTDNIISTLPACNSQNNGSLYIDGVPGPFPLSVSVADSATGIVVASTNVGMGINVISSTLLPGTYQIVMTYGMTAVPCPEIFYATVADAGTNCGTISGKVYADTVYNCIPDASEPGIPSQIVLLSPGPYYATTNSSGNYSALLPFNTYIVAQINTPQNYYAVCNPSPVAINAGTPTATANIGDTLNPNLDLRIGLSSNIARPGFNLHYSISVYNTSLITSGVAQVTFTADTLLQFVSCTHAYTYLGNGVYTVQLGPIGSYGGTTIGFNFTVPPNPGLIGNTLAATASVANTVTEPYLGNNADVITQIIMGAVDPNVKAVWPSRDLNNTFLTDIDSILSYTICFQNTGTDTAFTVLIADTLSEFLDFSTLQIKASSHPMTWSFEGVGVLKFTFNNILLPDSNTNEAASHGSVTYSIRPLSTLLLQTIIPNTVAIYFDFNPPVITNTITSLIDISVNVKETDKSAAALLVPNPASDKVTVMFKDAADNNNYTLNIVNLQGQTVMHVKNIKNHSAVSLKALPNGCYFYNVKGENGQPVNRQGKIIVSR